MNCYVTPSYLLIFPPIYLRAIRCNEKLIDFCWTNAEAHLGTEIDVLLQAHQELKILQQWAHPNCQSLKYISSSFEIHVKSRLVEMKLWRKHEKMQLTHHLVITWSSDITVYAPWNLPGHYVFHSVCWTQEHHNLYHFLCYSFCNGKYKLCVSIIVEQSYLVSCAGNWQCY